MSTQVEKEPWPSASILVSWNFVVFERNFANQNATGVHCFWPFVTSQSNTIKILTFWWISEWFKLCWLYSLRKTSERKPSYSATEADRSNQQHGGIICHRPRRHVAIVQGQNSEVAGLGPRARRRTIRTFGHGLVPGRWRPKHRTTGHTQFIFFKKKSGKMCGKTQKVEKRWEHFPPHPAFCRTFWTHKQFLAGVEVEKRVMASGPMCAEWFSRKKITNCSTNSNQPEISIF